MKPANKQPNQNWVKFKDLPEWKAKKSHNGGVFSICNPEGFYVGLYVPVNKTASLNHRSRLEHKNNCKNLHTAMQWMYLKTLKPNETGN